MSHLNAKSKFDVLQKYLGPAPTKKVKTNSIPQNKARVFDYELEGFDKGFQNGYLNFSIELTVLGDEDDEDAPLVVETPDSVKIDFDLKSKVLRGDLGKIGANKPLQPKVTIYL